ncbi:MAG TPA: hypothetical protein VGC13_13385 [Longimicrobium sp.]|jgi:DNA-directed RNA polymerase specialized sigma24 family protein|uniref:RNA polymerase sigma factor n=1 Tax=Longimicrobium sp. TaxID=2029185 RepID=UPI002ED833B7
MEANAQGRGRQNLAFDLVSSDPAVRRQAEERLPEFLSKGFQTAFAMLGNREDAEDAVTDALSRWLSNPGSYGRSARASELTWFNFVVHHTARGYLRQRYHKRVEHLQESSRSILNELKVLEEVERLYTAICALPEPHRRVLRVYLDWDDAPEPSRIAPRLGSVLGVPNSAAKAEISVALSALPREMGLPVQAPIQRDETSVESRPIDMLTAEFDALLERMQGPGTEEAMLKAYRSSPAELGRAAVAAARPEVR